jgi:hypothetical protein
MKIDRINQKKVLNGTKKFQAFISLLKKSSEQEIIEILGKGAMDEFLKAILNSDEVKKYPTIAEFFLANKQRLTLLSRIRVAINNNYSYKGVKEGKEAYVSPNHIQWFEDGVMFFEGSEPFKGFIGLYRNSQLSYAVAARDAKGGEKLGPDDFVFLRLEDFNRHEISQPQTIEEIEKPLFELKKLLDAKNNEEVNYQKFLADNAWVLGLQYKIIQNHSSLDENNIPDFTGKRVYDEYHDIIEIKQPFANIFNKDGEFSSYFNNAWNQTERYLNFANAEKDYLRRKGLFFDNPKAFLIIGRDLSHNELQKIRIKQKMNQLITVLTYDDLYRFIQNTTEILKKMKLDSKKTEE